MYTFLQESVSHADGNLELTLMSLPDELIVKIIDFLSDKDALWKLGFVSQRLLRLSLTSVKIIHIKDNDPSRLEILLPFDIVRNVIKHAILTKHTHTIGRQKLLHEMKNDSKDGDSNILDFLGEPTDKEILNLAKHCQNLESLYLIDCDKISDKAFITLSKSCTRLKTLNMCNCRHLKDESFRVIASNFINIVHLDLGNCINISDETISKIGSSCKNLESIDLFGCREVTSLGMRGFNVNCDKLKKISLSHCFKIRDEGIFHLVTNCQNIESLDLTNCIYLTDESIFHISANCSNIKVLILTKCDKLSLEPMLILISQCSYLHYMDIKGCLKISDDKIKRCWVKHQKKLQSLNTGRTCLEEMEKIREVMYDGTLSKEDFDKWRLEYYTGERSPATKNVG